MGILFTAILLALLAGVLVYEVLTLCAAWAYKHARPPELAAPPPISVLKPLRGLDEGLEENLRTFFTQSYSDFEILFAVADAGDQAVHAVRKLEREFPAVRSRLIVTGDPPYPNAKVFGLDHMLRAAQHELVVMGDSDVRVSPRLLEVLAREFQDSRVGLITCPYRAIAGRSLWSGLEAIFMNTEFLGGILVARLLNGMDFALGPTLAVRRSVFTEIGGTGFLKDYLAEDFVMGNRTAALGWRVLMSSQVIEHRIGSQKFAANLEHRLRWLRSTRRSRPWGYVGQLFTNPLPCALIVWAFRPEWWPGVIAVVGLRAVSAWAQAWWVARDVRIRRYWPVIPLQDLWSFFLWIAGFFGNTVAWRGRRYYLARDGRFELKN